MMEKPSGGEGRKIFQVSTAQRPDFKHPLALYVFDANGKRIIRVEVHDGKAELPFSAQDITHMRVFVAPIEGKIDIQEATAIQLERLGAYEPVLQPSGRLIDRIEVPGTIIDLWPFCFCWVRGRVVRHSDNRAVCNARVHICEVDRIPLWIAKLPDEDIFRLRDDLIRVLNNPPIPKPGPDLGPVARSAGRSTLRFVDNPVGRVSLNPQPLPPHEHVAKNRQLLWEAIPLATELSQLRSASPVMVRRTLIENWKQLLPWFCQWPHWWWLFRCDEIAVVSTDEQGRFETFILHSCGGDHPDIYFWVDYDLGTGFEIIYHPRVACSTYWNYVCGSEVTIRITDLRVPGCEDEPDLPGCQVIVLSIGRNIAVREVQTTGSEGLTNANEPFGATLEPRVDFSRSELINTKSIPYYRWSYRRLTGPDGVTTSVDAGSVPVNVWSVMTSDVYRHYKTGISFPSDFMGPMPTSGPNAAPAPNLFRIRPFLPPVGNEWVVLNENIDLATAYFDTAKLAGAPVSGPPWPDDLAAGLYELKMELFDVTGALVNWTARGVDLRITDQDAPFGTGIVTSSPAPDYNRVLSGGQTMGFRMVVRVDNNRCSAEILPVGGTVTPDPVCGFHNYNSPSGIAALSFIARHPNNFATYSLTTTRGSGPVISTASTSGTVGGAGNDSFNKIGAFTYSKEVVISTLLGLCSNAAFSERLDVLATATNGYGTLSGYDEADNAAFALATPCLDCSREDKT